MRALVVEDETKLAGLLGSYLERDGFDVAVVHDGLEAVGTARAVDPDVVVLDLGLPSLDGVEVCRQLRTFSDAYVVMLTARSEEVDTLIGLSVGADDYMTKPFSPRVLMARVQAMLRRPRQPEQPADALEGARTFGALVIDPLGRDVWLDGEPLSLTRTEFDLLAHLVSNPGVVVARDDLMRAVWASDFVPDSTHVVDVHLANLRRKLRGAAAGNQWIRTIRGVGFRFDPCCT